MYTQFLCGDSKLGSRQDSGQFHHTTKNRGNSNSDGKKVSASQEPAGEKVKSIVDLFLMLIARLLSSLASSCLLRVLPYLEYRINRRVYLICTRYNSKKTLFFNIILSSHCAQPRLFEHKFNFFDLRFDTLNRIVNLKTSTKYLTLSSTITISRRARYG